MFGFGITCRGLDWPGLRSWGEGNPDLGDGNGDCWLFGLNGFSSV